LRQEIGEVHVPSSSIARFLNLYSSNDHIVYAKDKRYLESLCENIFLAELVQVLELGSVLGG
jgi:hypothetical protein